VVVVVVTVSLRTYLTKHSLIHAGKDSDSVRNQFT